MGRVRVVTDSTADMDEAEARRYGIVAVPLNVHWDGETYRDKEEITTDEFYRKLREEKGKPGTSQPSAGQFEEVFTRLLQEADSVVAVLLSSKLSGTYTSAEVAARNTAPDRIALIDSLTISFPLGSMALRVARIAQDGASMGECVALARELGPRTRLVFSLDTLEFLRRGGRIGRAQALAGSLLSLKPIIQVLDGEVAPVDRVRTRGAAIKRIVEVFRSLGPMEEIAVLYGDAPESANQTVESLRSYYPEHDIAWGRIGPVLGTHTGPGVFGIGGILAR